METPWIAQGHVSPLTARLCGLEAFDTMSMPCSILTMALLPVAAGLRQRRGSVRPARHVRAREAAPDPPDPRENPGWG